MNLSRVLAIKFRSMGDTVLLTAPLLALRKALPRAEIHVAVSQEWSPLLRHHPAVDRLWTYERHRAAAARAKTIAKLALKLRREKFDAVICFHASPSSAMLAFATGAKIRSIHFHGHHDANRYSTVEIPGKGVVKPNIERDCDAIRALGFSIPSGGLPQIFLQPEERSRAREILGGLKGPYFGLGLGASRPTKVWPIERFAQIASRWLERTAGGVVIPIVKEELHLAEGLVAEALRLGVPRDRVLVVEDPEVRTLAGVLGHCSVFLGNDSGPRHVAVAVGTPTITLIGPEHPYEWHPYPSNLHPYFYVENLPCRKDGLPGTPSWCSLDVCSVEEHKCMKWISTEKVEEKLHELFRQNSQRESRSP